MPNNELQELLGARFKEHTHPTNESVWSAIEAQLDAQQKDRAGIWFWIFNGIAATLLLGIIAQSSLNSSNSLQSAGTQFAEESAKETTQAESNQPNQVNQAQEISNTEPFDSANSDSFAGDEMANEKSNGNSSIVNTIDLIKPNSKNSEGNLTIQDKVKRKRTANEALASNFPQISDVDLLVDELLPNSIASSHEFGAIHSVQPKITSSQTGGYFKRLPIHIGAECTYLNRTSYSSDAILILNPVSPLSNNELATKRHFEFSLFSQFDFTRRFSASAGIGYSYSRYTNTAAAGAAFSSSSIEESQLDLITVPIQSKFMLLNWNRISLSTGLTFQGEFGRIAHIENLADESITTIDPQVSSLESLNVDKSKIRQFALEPFLQVSVNVSPRISVFGNTGYRMYRKQANPSLAPVGRLNYFNADVGLLFRLK